ncbi:MAG TPA: cation:proton antiporter [archaeon]|nr:cation:proton antiporter [archaeon]
MNPEVFIELSKILVITVLAAGITRLLKQPIIISYILSGIIVGPFILNVVSSIETLTAFSQIGIAFLLFMVGLNLNPRVIKEVGKISLITGIGQVIFTSLIGYAIALMLGFTEIVSFYVSIALAFSSTIIIMKVLSDKRDLDTLYGRISIGFLIVQDFIAIAILLIISSFKNGVSFEILAFQTILNAFIALILLFLATIYFLPSLTKFIAKSQEFLMLFSISWCFAIASIFYFLNFSIEAGALIAGISLSLSPYQYEISSKMKPLRDFFLILFFIILGSQMIFSNIFESLTAIIVFSLFVLIGNPIIVMILMGRLGYTKRNSFLSGLTVAQISEFSLIVIALGVTLGHLSKEILSIVTAVGLITFAVSTYMIMYSEKIYLKLSNYLTIFERKGKKADEKKQFKEEKYDIILFGYNRIGFDILESLKKIKKKFLVVDYDPEVISKLSKQGIKCRFGDADNFELLNDLNLSQAKMIISTIPLPETNNLLLKKAREENKKAIIAVVSHKIEDAVKYYEQGATYVIMPHFLGGKHFSSMIEKNKTDRKKFLEEKKTHLKNLKERKQEGQEHPMHESL